MGINRIDNSAPSHIAENPQFSRKIPLQSHAMDKEIDFSAKQEVSDKEMQSIFDSYKGDLARVKHTSFQAKRL
ncbi:MAG: hypothetical protein FJZ56_04160 [Chlamydiae bacterium]|nr:hypothetical protein [Chlamydiota bacterium]